MFKVHPQLGKTGSMEPKFVKDSLLIMNCFPPYFDLCPAMPCYHLNPLLFKYILVKRKKKKNMGKNGYLRGFDKK